MPANAKAADAYIELVPRLSQSFARDVATQVDHATSGITRQISDKLKTVGSSVRQAGLQMSTFLTLPIVGGFKVAFDAASDLNEAINVTGLTFGAQRGPIDSFSKEAARALGLSETAARQLTAGLGGLLQNLGFAQDESVAWSQDLARLGADMGSAFNVEPAEAIEAIGSALRGETEPIRRFNVMLDDATVRAKAVELGLADTTAEVDAHGKAQATLALIMEQTSAVQGDFANTADGAANQQRILRAEFENAAATLGQQLLPIGLQLLGFVKDLLQRFTALSPSVQRFVLIGLAVLAVIGPLVSVVGALATAIGFLISGPGLVVIALVALVAAVIYAYNRFESFRNLVDSVVRWFLDVAVPAIQEFWASIVEGATTVWAIVQPVLEEIIGFIVEKFTQVADWAREIWPQVSEAIGHVMALIQANITVILTAVQFIWDNFGTHILTAVQLVWGLIQTVINFALQFIQGIIQTALALINGDWGRAWDGIKLALGAVWDLMFGIVSFAVGSLINVLSAGLSFIAGLFGGTWSAIVDGVAAAAGAVVSWISGIPGALLGLVGSFASAGASLATGLLDGIKGAITGAFGFAADIAGALVGALKSAWNSFARTVNDLIPNSIGWGPASIDLPDSPIPTFHQGGWVPGYPGQERLAIVEGGEFVVSRDMIQNGDAGRDRGTVIESLTVQTMEPARSWLDELSWRSVVA